MLIWCANYIIFHYNLSCMEESTFWRLEWWIGWKVKHTCHCVQLKVQIHCDTFFYCAPMRQCAADGRVSKTYLKGGVTVPPPIWKPKICLKKLLKQSFWTWNVLDFRQLTVLTPSQTSSRIQIQKIQIVTYYYITYMLVILCNWSWLILVKGMM